MAVLTWDETGKKFYETGVDRGVLFPVDLTTGAYAKGVAWSGLTNVTETPSGAEQTDLYADNIKYLSLTSAETFEGKIEAYTYPDEWLQCDGSVVVDKVVIGQQDRSAFGLAYRTIKGNDQKKNNYGYKLHLLYGLNASPSERSYATVNDSPEAITFSWSFKGTPVNVTGHKPTCVVTLDSTVVGNKGMTAIEKLIWGDGATESKLPTPDEVITAVKVAV